MMRESELSICSNCEKEIVGPQSNCIYCKEKKIENARRMLLKISTAIMISIVGPASAWSAMQEQGLMLYILFYMVSKSLASKIAARSTFVAIKSYRYAPLLLLFSGLLSFAPGNVVNYTVILPMLLGAYEGAYWAVYFDYKPWVNKIDIEDKSQIRIATIPIGILTPKKDSLIAARLTSVPFATIQFVLQQSMRFLSLRTGGVLYLGLLVVSAEIISYLIVLAYTKYTERQDDLIKTQKTLMIWGQVIMFCGIVLMIIGQSYESFMIYLLGWLISQGSARGCVRKIEIAWSQNHLKNKKVKKQNAKDRDELDKFQRNEVIASFLGVMIATGLTEQQLLSLNPALIGGVFALIAWLIKFPTFDFRISKRIDNLEIGLRERLKFNNHLYIVCIFIMPAMFFSVHVLVLSLLLFGLSASIIGVAWAKNPKAIPSNIG